MSVLHQRGGKCEEKIEGNHQNLKDEEDAFVMVPARYVASCTPVLLKYSLKVLPKRNWCFAEILMILTSCKTDLLYLICQVSAEKCIGRRLK
jgi:hypothetical protein